MRQQQTGFTLIEIVAVIVLLGILAATALPRFVNLQSDARVATLNGVVGGLKSAHSQVFAKALIGARTSSANQTVTIDGTAVEVTFGYPEAVAESGVNQDISDFIDVDGSLVSQDDTADFHVGYDFDGDSDVSDDACFVTYNESASAGAAPVIATSLGSC